MTSLDLEPFPPTPTAVRQILLGHAPGEAITLKALDAEVRMDSLRFQGPMTASLDLLPRPSVRLRGSLESVGTGEALFTTQRMPETVLSYVGGAKPIPLATTEYSWNPFGGAMALTAATRDPSVTLNGECVPTGLTFLLLNQSFTSASTAYTTAESDAQPTACLSFDGWKVWVWRRPDLADIIQRTTALGSFVHRRCACRPGQTG